MIIAGLAARGAAAPGDNESTERISYHQPDPAASQGAAPSEGWVELADPTPASHGKEFIAVGAGAGPFTRLRIDAAKGRPRLQQVRIDFKDGGRRVSKVQMVLGKERSAYIDLGGAREISQIVVITDWRSRGSYTVHAQPNQGGVATR